MADFENIPIDVTAQQIENIAKKTVVESISSLSTHEEIPTAKTVYNYVRTNGGGTGGGSGQDAVWWSGIPDNVVLNYDAQGNRKVQSVKYNGILMRGDEPIVKNTAIPVDFVASMNAGINYTETTGEVEITIYCPATIQKDKTPDIEYVELVIDGVSYKLNITVSYVFDGEKGEDGASGIYIGSGEMPEGYNIQLDPDAVPDVDMVYNAESEKPQSGKAVAQAIEQALANFVNVAEVGQ